MSLVWLAALLAACGDDGGGDVGDDDDDDAPIASDDFVGYWRVAEVAFRSTDPEVCGDEEICDDLFVAGDDARGVVGFGRFTSSGDPDLALKSTLLVLIDEIPAGLPGTFEAPGVVVPEANQLVFEAEEPVGTIVFDVLIESDRVTLTLDEEDPRTGPADRGQPVAVTLERAEEPAGWSVGSWAATSLAIGDGDRFDPSECQTPSLGVWTTTSLVATFEEDHLFTWRFRTQTYDDAGCTEPDGKPTLTPLDGMAFESETGIELYVAFEGAPGSRYRFDATSTDPDLDLERTECEPDPPCGTSTVAGVTFERVEE